MATATQMKPDRAILRYPGRCNTCDRIILHQRFPPSAKLSCHHPVESCAKCLNEWFSHQLISVSPRNLSCIQCPNVLQQADLKLLATHAIYQRYQDLELRATLSSIDNFLWCIAPDCKGGQLHLGGQIFSCGSCGHKHCVACQAPWHEGWTCQELKLERERVAARSSGRIAEEEDASAKALAETTKKCPGCGSTVVRISGCDHMVCTQCDYEFCWECLAEQEAIFREGNHLHKEDCRHYAPWEERAVDWDTEFETTLDWLDVINEDLEAPAFGVEEGGAVDLRDGDLHEQEDRHGDALAW